MKGKLMKKEIKAVEKKKSIKRIINSTVTDGNKIVANVYDDANYTHDDTVSK